MSFEVGLIGEDLVEDETARSVAIFGQEVSEVLRVAADERDKWQRCGPQLRFLAALGLDLGDDCIGPSRNLGIASTWPLLRRQ